MLESDGTLFTHALLKARDSHYAACTNTSFYPMLTQGFKIHNLQVKFTKFEELKG